MKKTIMIQFFIFLTACGIQKGKVPVGVSAESSSSTQLTNSEKPPVVETKATLKTLKEPKVLKISTRFKKLLNYNQYRLLAVIFDQNTGVETPLDSSKMLFSLEGTDCQNLSIEKDILYIEYQETPLNCILIAQSSEYTNKDSFLLQF